jgi:hypothetical protein
VSTSFLYHAFGIRRYEYVRTYCRGGAMIFTIRLAPRSSLLGLRPPRGHPPRPRRGPLPHPDHRQPEDVRILPISRVECRAHGAVS